MRLDEIIDCLPGKLVNGSVETALRCMASGYRFGRPGDDQQCYAYVGSQLAALDPPDATIQLWAMPSGTIIHGAAVLPDGTEISDTPLEKYRKARAHVAQEIPLADFKAMLAPGK